MMASLVILTVATSNYLLILYGEFDENSSGDFKMRLGVGGPLGGWLGHPVGRAGEG